MAVADRCRMGMLWRNTVVHREHGQPKFLGHREDCEQLGSSVAAENHPAVHVAAPVRPDSEAAETSSLLAKAVVARAYFLTSAGNAGPDLPFSRRWWAR
jgi:hypothetical protein